VPDPVDAESAVRSYLLALEDPAKLVDQSQIADLEATAKSASDPIDKLRALAKLDEARNVNIASYQLAFIQHAKQWASDNDIPGSTFRSLGVDDSTLRAAGLLARSPKATATGGQRTRSSTAPRSSSVSANTIKAHVAKKSGSFTLADIGDEVGGSPMTLRKAIAEMVADGSVAKLGTDPSHSGRGRAPIVYERSSK
jgi:hypothetical protein